jgi:spore coat protein U-like protein
MIRQKKFPALWACTVFACIAGLGAASLSADASTSRTAQFLVSLTVTSDCSISASALAFGSANSSLATTAITQNTSLSVTCTNGTSYTVSLDKGTGANSAVTGRLMSGTGSNTQTVEYQLYSNVGMTTIWGDATGGTIYSGTGTGALQSLTVYGQVPAQTIPAADNYSSTETATVTF